MLIWGFNFIVILHKFSATCGYNDGAPPQFSLAAWTKCYITWLLQGDQRRIAPSMLFLMFYLFSRQLSSLNKLASTYLAKLFRQIRLEMMAIEIYPELMLNWWKMYQSLLESKPNFCKPQLHQDCSSKHNKRTHSRSVRSLLDTCVVKAVRWVTK